MPFAFKNSARCWYRELCSPKPWTNSMAARRSVSGSQACKYNFLPSAVLWKVSKCGISRKVWRGHYVPHLSLVKGLKIHLFLAEWLSEPFIEFEVLLVLDFFNCTEFGQFLCKVKQYFGSEEGYTIANSKMDTHRYSTTIPYWFTATLTQLFAAENCYLSRTEHSSSCNFQRYIKRRLFRFMGFCSLVVPLLRRHFLSALRLLKSQRTSHGHTSPISICVWLKMICSNLWWAW